MITLDDIVGKTFFGLEEDKRDAILKDNIPKMQSISMDYLFLLTTAGSTPFSTTFLSTSLDSKIFVTRVLIFI